MIIFNEKQYIEQLLAHGFPSRFSKRDIILLARHFREQGLSETENYDEIVKFCRKWSKKFIEPKYQTAILDAIFISAEPRSTNLRAETINFSKNELDKLARLGKAHSDLLFVMMCICKLYGRDNLWVNSKSKIKLSEIAELAGLNLPNRKQELLIHDLIVAGAINQMFPNCLQLKMAWLDHGKPVLSFAPSEHMVSEWRMWFRKNYIECELCGRVVPRSNNKMKYCAECAFEEAARQRREYNAKHR